MVIATNHYHFNLLFVVSQIKVNLLKVITI